MKRWLRPKALRILGYFYESNMKNYQNEKSKFKMLKTYLVSVAIFVVGAGNSCYAAPLEENSAELKQLIATGYDIKKTEKDDTWTIASNSDGKIVLDRSSERLAVSILFTRKEGLSENQDYELRKIVNQINVDTVYQASLGDNYLTLAIYLFGPHNPKAFAKSLRLLEKASNIHESHPKLLELMNN